MTDNDERADLLRALRSLCCQNGNRVIHERTGWNDHMAKLQADVDIAQVKTLDAILKRKREAGLWYKKNSESLEQRKLGPSGTESGKNFYWVFAIVLENTGLNARGFIDCWWMKRWVLIRSFILFIYNPPSRERIRDKVDQ